MSSDEDGQSKKSSEMRRDIHIEGHGKYVLIRKPRIEKLPREFSNPLRTDITGQAKVLQESQFNVEMKKKKKQGLVKEENINELQMKLD